MNSSARLLMSKLMVLAIVCLPVFAYGQTNRSSISGFIFDNNRRPVSQIVVELQNEFSTIARTRTDGSGRYFFGGLSQGRFTVKALPFGTGLLEQSEDIEIAGIGVTGRGLAENVQKDIYLKLRRGADAIPFQNEVIYVQEVPREAEALYKRGVADLDSQRTETGIESLEKAVSIFPDYFMALQKLGIVRLSQEKYEEAADLFTRALKINGRGFDSLYGLAYANYTIRKFAEAVTAAKKAVEQKGESMEANLLLGMSLRMTKELIEAEKALRTAEKIGGRISPDVHWHLALLYGKDMEKYEDAAKQLELYLKAAPDVANKEEVKKLIKHFRDKAKAGS